MSEDTDHLARSDFAFPETRKGPLNDAVAVRAAMSGFRHLADASDEERDKAWTRVKAAAHRFGVDVREADWREIGRG